jgi:TonB family protein
MHFQTEEQDEELGTPAIEIGLDLAAPHLEASDLPPGPEAEASTASPTVVEQKAEVKESLLPKAEPKETEDPDQLVSPDATKPPENEKPVEKKSEAAPSSESVASEATAPPTSQIARESPHSTAPVQGTGESMQRVRTTWQKQLVAHLDHNKRYPQNGIRRSVQIVVSFTLDRLGHVLAANIVQGSGDAAFDEAALAMMHRADPVPPPPPVVADEGLSFTLPVLFRSKGQS